jgi:hypothetical protein
MKHHRLEPHLRQKKTWDIRVIAAWALPLAQREPSRFTAAWMPEPHMKISMSKAFPTRCGGGPSALRAQMARTSWGVARGRTPAPKAFAAECPLTGCWTERAPFDQEPADNCPVIRIAPAGLEIRWRSLQCSFNNQEPGPAWMDSAHRILRGTYMPISNVYSPWHQPC